MNMSEIGKKVKIRYSGSKSRCKARIPAWFGEFDEFVILECHELALIREVYSGFRWDVDHIVPINGRRVSGLHCWQNVQVIPKRINSSKCNSFEGSRKIEPEDGEFQSSDFRSPSKMKKAAYQKPVMITEHGSIEFVLMTISDYEKLQKAAKK